MLGYICCSNCAIASNKNELCKGCLIEQCLKLKKMSHGLMLYTQFKSFLVR